MSFNSEAVPIAAIESLVAMYKPKIAWQLQSIKTLPTAENNLGTRYCRSTQFEDLESCIQGNYAQIILAGKIRVRECGG